MTSWYYMYFMFATVYRLLNYIIWVAPGANVSAGIYGQGLHCPLTESLDTTECMNGE